MKFFTLLSYVTGMLVVAGLEITVLRLYDPSVFSYVQLLSVIAITGLSLTILLALIPKAS
jgi:hypothetical protein